MMKMEIKDANCRVVLSRLLGGSVLKGTVFNRWESVTTDLKVVSDEPEDRLRHLIKNAKAGCFAEGLITQQVPLHSHIELNGQPFHLEGVTEE